MKVVRPDGSVMTVETFKVSEFYTVEGWYLLINNEYSPTEVYLKDKKQIGYKTYIGSGYYFYPTDSILNSKEEFSKYLKLMAFI